MEFYRYEMDPFGDIVLRQYYMVKETKKGYWIKRKSGFASEDTIWISKDSKKRYAYPSQEQALFNYKKRTEARLRILENHVEKCKTILRFVEARRITER